MPFVNPGTSAQMSRLKKLYENDPAEAERAFGNLCHFAAAQNRQFLDGMFHDLREDKSFVDFALVDGEGRNQGTYGSFIEMLAQNEPPSNREILEGVIKSGRFTYPVTPTRNRLLFFPQGDAEVVASANGEDSGHLPIFRYSSLFLSDNTPIDGMWVHPRAGYAHAPEGYVVGIITFWDTRLGTRSEREGRKDIILVQHSAYIPKHPATGGKVTITPLERSGVVATGGLTVDTKYGTHRVETVRDYHGFVAGAMEAYRRDPAVNGSPLVLAYTARKKLEFMHSTSR